MKYQLDTTHGNRIIINQGLSNNNGVVWKNRLHQTGKA